MIQKLINRFKFYQLSSFAIPFFRVKWSSYIKELAYILNPIFRLINCLDDLILEINVMLNGLISGFVFFRSNMKFFFRRCYLLKMIGLISFMLFTPFFKHNQFFGGQRQDVVLVKGFWCKPFLDCFLYKIKIFYARSALKNIYIWKGPACVMNILLESISLGLFSNFAGSAGSIWFYAGSIKIFTSINSHNNQSYTFYTYRFT